MIAEATASLVELTTAPRVWSGYSGQAQHSRTGEASAPAQGSGKAMSSGLALRRRRQVEPFEQHDPARDAGAMGEQVLALRGIEGGEIDTDRARVQGEPLHEFGLDAR